MLTADATVTSLVSTRIYPLRLPQNITLPAIRYQLIQQTSDHNFTGYSEFGYADIQFDAYAATALSAAAIADAIRLAVGFKRGTYGTVYIQSVHPTGVGRQLIEEPIDASDAPLYRHSRDFRFWFTESD